MNALVQKLELETTAFLAGIAQMTTAQQQFQPTPESWNALQVVAHLVLVEHGLLSVPAEKRGEFSWRTRAVHFWLVQGLKLPIRVGAPVKGVKPQDPPNLSTLQNQWQEAREFLRQRLAQPEITGQPFSRHPISGAMTKRQTLMFFRAHLFHHHHQLNRIRQAAGFSSETSS